MKYCTRIKCACFHHWKIHFLLAISQDFELWSETFWDKNPNFWLIDGNKCLFFSSGRSLESIHITWTQFAHFIFVICLDPHFSAFTAERLTCIFRARSQQWKLPVWVWSSRGRWKHGRQQWRGPCPISGRWGNRVSAMLWSHTHTHTSKHKLWISSQDGEAQAHT